MSSEMFTSALPLKGRVPERVRKCREGQPQLQKHRQQGRSSKTRWALQVCLTGQSWYLLRKRWESCPRKHFPSRAGHSAVADGIFLYLEYSV